MDSNSNTSLVSREKRDEMQRQREKLLASCMAMLATGLGVEITNQRVVLYQRPLADLTDSQIKRGFQQALKNYKPYGGSFPSPGELRAYALEEGKFVGVIDDSKEVLSRGTKPPGWEPVSIDEIRKEIAARKSCEWPS